MDTAALVLALQDAGSIHPDASLSLGGTLKEFGVEPVGQMHDALTDARAVAALYWEITNMLHSRCRT